MADVLNEKSAYELEKILGENSELFLHLLNSNENLGLFTGIAQRLERRKLEKNMSKEEKKIFNDIFNKFISALKIKGYTYENGRVIKGNTGGDEEEVSFSLESALKTLKEYPKNDNRKIVRDYRGIKKFINKSLDETNYVDKIHIGIVNDKTAKLVKDKTNIDIYNYSVTLNTNDIRHIFNRHKTSNYSFEIPIDRTNGFTIIETIINPDKIEHGRYGKSLKFIKTLDYVYTAIELAYKNKTISLKTGYINKINGLKNVLMPSNNRVANNTSETHSNAVYNSNLTDNNEDVNTKYKIMI